MLESRHSGALFTDLYELTMAEVTWRRGMNRSATFTLSFRGYHADRGFYAVAGIETALEHLEQVQFNETDLEFLSSTSRLSPEFMEWLGPQRFTGSVRAMREGDLAFADEPVLEVTAPLIEAQIAETALLNAVTFQSNVLTKAVRIKQAAGGRPVVEFGARRAQGRDAADFAARCAVIAGFSGTSNVSAAARFGLPLAGTMAHLFVQSFDSELAAFRAYAERFPDSTTLLIDTYDTVEGARNAVTVAHEMEPRGHRLSAVRLDSGDMRELSTRVRQILDDSGLEYVQIIATGGLDEHSISELVASGAPIDGFGVGTRFVVSADAPYADSVYKLVAYDGNAVGKLSPGKSTLPGAKQVYRMLGEDGMFERDVIATAEEAPSAGGIPLLEPLMANGRRTEASESVQLVSDRLSRQLSKFPEQFRALQRPERFPVSVSDGLHARQVEIATRHGQEI